MKSKLIVIIVLVIAGLGATILCLSSVISTNSEHKGFLKKAKENADNEIPYVAMVNYNKAFDIKNPTEEQFCEYMEQMKLLGEDYYDEAVKMYLTKFPMSSNAYELNLERLYKAENYKAAVDLALEAREKGIATEAIKNYYIDSFYKYKYVKTGFEYGSMFLGDNALVQKGGLYGYLTSYGDYLIEPTFKGATFLLGSTAAVDDGQEWCMVNTLGFRIARTSERVDELSFISNGLVLAKKGDKYTYLNSSLNVPENFPYDDATNFKNNVAAVKKDNKWALVGSDGKNITEFVFDDIKRDEFNTCINNGIIFAKTGDKYFMYNASGKKVSDNAFDDVFPFVGTQPAAVKVGDKWGFVNEKGETVVEPAYEDAKSYNCSLAPVCQNGVWNYVDTSGIVRISGDFEDAKPFASNGIAVIKEGEVWNYIRLITYFD